MQGCTALCHCHGGRSRHKNSFEAANILFSLTYILKRGDWQGFVGGILVGSITRTYARPWTFNAICRYLSDRRVFLSRLVATHPSSFSALSSPLVMSSARIPLDLASHLQAAIRLIQLRK